MLGISDIRNLTSEFNMQKGALAGFKGTADTQMGIMTTAQSQISALEGERQDLFTDNDTQNGIIKDMDKADRTSEENRDKAIQEASENILDNKDGKHCVTAKKFVNNQGMCGMGMGMGDEYSCEGAISLSANAMKALAGLLPDESQMSKEAGGNPANFECIARELQKELGANYEVTASCEENCITIKNKLNGQTEKVYDANGNGALDDADYKFCEALAKVAEYEQEFEDEKTRLEGICTSEMNDHAQTRNAAKTKIEQNEARIATINNTEIPGQVDAYNTAKKEYNTAVGQIHTTESSLEGLSTQIGGINWDSYTPESEGYDSDFGTLSTGNYSYESIGKSYQLIA